VFWIKIKRVWLSLYVNFMAVLVSICSMFQYIRRLLSQLLLVPSVVLVIMTVGTCALFLIGAFMMEGALLANLGQMGIMCAAVIVLFFLAKLVLFAVSFVLEMVLAIFDLQQPIRKTAVWMESAIESYVFTIAGAPMTKTGYRALFFLPSLLHKIGDGLEWLLDRAGILIYPLSAIGGVMICRSWYLETWDSGWRTIDYAVAVVMTMIVIGLMLYVGSYVVDAVRKAKPEERVLAVFYGTYMNFYGNMVQLERLEVENETNRISQPQKISCRSESFVKEQKPGKL